MVLEFACENTEKDDIRGETEYKEKQLKLLTPEWQDNKLLILLHTDKEEGEWKVAEGCQERGSVRDSASKPVRTDESCD